MIGATVTKWTGTAFNCAQDGNEILLRHSQYNETEGTQKECNDGEIRARSVEADGNCYTSELNVTTSTAMNGRTVCCQAISDSGIQQIDNATVTVISGTLPCILNSFLSPTL